jgi:peroxiredoxin
LAEYRDLAEDFRSAGAGVAPISADLPAESEALRRQLRLPFPLLCDPERRVITAWRLLNPKEMGGIAVPAVIVLDRELRVRLRRRDRTEARVPAAAVLAFVVSGMPDATDAVRRRLIIPRAREWRGAFTNGLRRRRLRRG